MRGSLVGRIFAKFQLAGEPDFIHLKIGQPKSWSEKYPDVPPPDSKLSIQFIAAAWTSRDLHGEDMPSIAANLLEQGIDSPALRRLAGEMNVRCSADVADLVAKMFKEFNLPCPMPELQAKLIISRQMAKEVIAGERDPAEAGSYLELITWEREAPNEELSMIFALNDELEWDPEYQRYCRSITTDLIDAFARLAKLTDAEIFASSARPTP